MGGANEKRVRIALTLSGEGKSSVVEALAHAEASAEGIAGHEGQEYEIEFLRCNLYSGTQRRIRLKQAPAILD